VLRTAHRSVEVWANTVTIAGLDGLSASTTFPIGLHHLFASGVDLEFLRVTREDEKRDEEFQMQQEVELTLKE
jgi:hypothetical protein